MDTDCEMDFSFAKRLQKQQMRSPTSVLITKPYHTASSCKRHLELDVNQVLCAENYEKNTSEMIIDTEENYENEEMVLKTNNSCMDIVNEEFSKITIPKHLTNDSLCELNTKTPEKQLIHKYNDATLRLHKPKQEIQPACDRYIPLRTGNNWQTNFSTVSRNMVGEPVKKIKLTSDELCNESAAYNYVLRNELLGENIEGVQGYVNNLQAVSSPEKTNLFKFSSPVINGENVMAHNFSISPVGPMSQQLLRSPCKTVRKISKLPYKILDAPELENDFYLNLVDWSSQNMLGVGLGSCVYLWSAHSSQVVRLCDMLLEQNSVTAVAWNENGNYLTVGTHSGVVQIWDVAVSKKVAQFTAHAARVGVATWNGNILSTGSRDRMIILRDIRTSTLMENFCCIYEGHRQEVCGLKWSLDGQYLASGGNDNRLFVWSKHSNTPVQIYGDHSAAVKAIAWSPHQHGLLASGGGTRDRCIKLRNTLTYQSVQSVDTGSQVCCLAWSKNSPELVSTHGYSLNQIVVWKYPSLTKVVQLIGHSQRVLYLAMSPDGESIVTGAGDETLRFWNIFSKPPLQKENKSVLKLFSSIR